MREERNLDKNQLCELNEEGGRRTADFLQRGPIAGPRKLILGGEDCELKRWSNAGRTDLRSQLRARAVQATALFSDLRGERKMKMERQEKNKQQSRHAHGTAHVKARFHSGNRHGDKASQ